MISPVDFDTFFKVVGGSSILSFVTQLYSILNIKLEIDTTIQFIKENRPKSHAKQIRFPDEKIEVFIDDANSSLNTHLRYLLWGFILGISSIMIYAVTSNIPYLNQTNIYIVLISLLTYFFVIIIPSIIAYNLFKVFWIYYTAMMIKIRIKKVQNNDQNFQK
jgi:hypothetical protein